MLCKLIFERSGGGWKCFIFPGLVMKPESALYINILFSEVYGGN